MSDVGALEATLASVNPRETVRPRSLDSTISADALDATLPETVATAAKADLEPMAQRFALGATLGQGGMAIVRIGRQRSLQREVAVKMMRGDATDDASPRMLREAWITGALEHPNIVPVHDLGTDERGRPMLVLKRIEGKPWSELIAHKPLEWNLQQLVHVCNAIAFAHSRGIVHRDLKPANIMIGEFGEVNVLDWGIAVSLVDDGTGRLPLAASCNEVAGTLAYMAPEMLGTAPVTARTDVYLLGAILFEIATRKPPHLCESISATIASIGKTPPFIPHDVPAELATILRRALARNPAERFAGANELRDAITAFLEHRGSAVLAERAAEQLVVLEAHLGDKPERARAYELFGEVRFGFQAALRAWADNTEARAGLDRALTAMTTYELDHGDARTAAILLADIVSPPAELAERVATAERAAVDRTKRLVRYEADADVTRDSVVRTMFLLVCGIVWTALPFTAAMVPELARVGHGISIITTAIVVAGMAIFGWVARHKMLSTTWNRGVYLVALLGMVLHGTLEAITWFAGIDMVMTHIISVGVWSGVVGVAAIFLDRALLFGSLSFLLTVAAIAWKPAAHLQTLSAGVAVLLGVVVYIFYMQKRGRKICGLVDMIRADKP